MGNDLWNFSAPHVMCTDNLAWFALGMLVVILVMQYAQKVMK